MITAEPAYIKINICGSAVLFLFLKIVLRTDKDENR